MNERNGTTIEALVSTLRQRRARVPAEIGTFVALEVTEAMIRRPSRVALEHVRVAEDGTVLVFEGAAATSHADSARSVLNLLAALLVAAGTSVPRQLVGIVEDADRLGPDPLRTLRDELESSLVPLNRGAARRVLSRMIREAQRPASERPPPSADAKLDAEVDALFDDVLASDDGAPTNERPRPAMRDAAPIDGPVEARPKPQSIRPDADPKPRRVSVPPPSAVLTDSLADSWGADATPEPPRPREPAVREPAVREPVRDEPSRAREEARGPREADATSPSLPRKEARAARAAVESEPPPRPAKRREREIDDGLDEAPRRGGAGTWIALSLVLVALAGGFVYARQFVPALMAPASTEPEPVLAPPAPAPRAGTLVVRPSVERAQVFLFVGRGPISVDQLPRGVAHEFLVVADGMRPARALVPATSDEWETTSEGPRFELAVQANEPGSSDEFGPSLMPSGTGTAGELGSVRVVTNPRGAKVFQLVGFAPEARIEGIDPARAYELMVIAEGYGTERVVVGPSDWREEGEGSLAEVSVTLERARR